MYDNGRPKTFNQMPIIIGNSIYRRGSVSATVPPNGIPSGLTLTVISDTEIQLDWTAGTTNHDGHSIERSTDNATWAEIATITGSTVHYHNTGLTAGTLYYYRVRAYKGVLYSNYSNTDSDITFTSEYITYVTGIAPALSGSQANRLNTLIQALKTGLGSTNLSDDFDCLWVFGAETAETQIKNLVKDDHHCTRSNANGKFVKFLGYSGGTKNYLLTDFWLDVDGITYTRNDNSFGVYTRNDGANPWCEIGAKKDAVYSFVCIIPNYGNGNAYYNNNAAANLDYASPVKTNGLLVTGRSASNRIDYFIDGISVDNSSDASEVLPHKEIHIGAIDPVAGSGLHSPNTQYFAFIGRYFSAAEQIIIKNAFDAYITSIESERTVQMVLQKGLTYNGWDADAIAAPSVCWDGIRYVMTVSFWSDFESAWATAFFTSPDLINWSYVNNSLIEPSPGGHILGNAGLAWFDSKYWFAYQNNGNPVGLSWSTDLLNWNLVDDDLVPAGYDPSINVNPNTNKLELWYVHITSRNIYVLESSDGTTWSAPVLAVTAPSTLSDFGAPTVFYIGTDRYMVVDSSLKSGWRRLYLWHDAGSLNIWKFDCPILFPYGTGWEHEQVSDCGIIIADLGDGLGAIPRVIYTGSDNNSAIDDTDSSLGLYNLIIENY